MKRAGLAYDEVARPGPLVGSRAVRLWTLTPGGQALLTRRRLALRMDAGGLPPYGRPARWPDTARPRDVPMLLAAYRLLAHVVRGLDRPVRLAAWEHPWIRTLGATEAGRARYVRLPAAAALLPDAADRDRPPGWLLLPDLGTRPLSSYRPVLRRLLELRATVLVEQTEPLLIVGVAAGASSAARAAAWQALIQQVGRQAGERPLRARVLVCPGEATAGGTARHHLGDRVDQLLGLVARHPLLTRPQLATVLDISRARAGQLIRRLEAAGWVRSIAPARARPEVLGGGQVRQGCLALVELTPAGRREAARRLLLPAGVAARHHGLLGTAASLRQFVRHLDHTRGANAVFVALVSTARRLTECGGDDALVEWRCAAACARGRFRPDGYGCYRRGPWRFGFFLEYDRGTERAGQYAAKLATYYRYRDSGASRRDYQSFPALLVVTTCEAAEARFAHQAYLAQQRSGGVPLRVFLTTTARLQAHPERALGPVWRSPGPWWTAKRSARVRWLPELALGRARRLPTPSGRGWVPS